MPTPRLRWDPPPPSLLARTGSAVFAGTLVIALGLGLTAGEPAPRVLAASTVDDTPPADRFLPPLPTPEPTPAPTPVPTPEPPPSPRPVAVRAAQEPATAATEGAVVASWYGPGFYGNRTACGQLYTPEIVGVAHRSLPCGTLISITSPAGITVVVPVIDRGPFIAGRTLDLSNATRAALACSDLCTVRMRIVD
ncbi:MAG TPA: septal ring lytic transglycosylase RlpA family protein [Candidatus Limnocylindrales bacterium]|nr:septal ring lytic transglycosylase RlpA family protein [Candidatus Limnocylindrales bacterium]